MAFVALGNRGTASSKTAAAVAGGSQSSLSMSPNQEIPRDRLVVVFAAQDSYSPVGGNEGSPSFTAACYDTAGNVYTTIAGGTDGQSNIYSQCQVYISRIRFPITVSDTITVYAKVQTFGQTAPRAMSVEEFSLDGDKVMALVDQQDYKVTNRAADPGAVNITGLQSGREYLFLHALAAEGPNTDAYTWDSDYTQISGDGTTGGADDSNIHLRGGYRIATRTSDTIDVTSTTADRDYTQEAHVLTEIPLVPNTSFPTNTTILDDFNRADEDPVNGGLWDTGSCSPRVSAGSTRHCRITSNQLRASSATANVGGSWYIDPTGTWGQMHVCEGFDLFATIAVSQAFMLTMRGIGCAESTNTNGLSMQYIGPPTSGEILAAHLVFGSMSNNGSSIDNPRGRSWQTLPNGSRVGMSVVRVNDSPSSEQYIYYWLDTNDGNGFRLIHAVHARGNLSGSNGATAIKVGVAINNSVTRIDDIGGGPTSGWCDLFRPQFYRRVPA